MVGLGCVNWRVLGGVFGGLGVCCGAFGAHGLKNRISDPALVSSWSTAAHYQMVHAVMMTVTASSPGITKIVPALFAAGCVCFSGSIYGLVLLSKESELRKVLGPITPLGGLMFTAGWFTFAWQAR